MKLLNHVYDKEIGSLTVWVEPDMSDWSVEIALVPEGESFAASVVEVETVDDGTDTDPGHRGCVRWLQLSHIQASLHMWWLTLRS